MGWTRSSGARGPDRSSIREALSAGCLSLPLAPSVTSAGATAVLLAAGGLAGALGTAGGITSLVSYPALLAVGLPARAASVANIVALVACWPGSALASRPELAGRGGWLRRWCTVSALGGAVGALALLLTPPAAFESVVPYLVAAASLLLVAQPSLSSWVKPQAGGESVIFLVGLFSISVYNGYFGAGAGIMTLAAVLVLVEPDLVAANALKNMLVGAATVASAIIFVVSAHVEWGSVAPLSAGMLLGSTLGPRMTRRVPARILRSFVALVGLGLAVTLWVKS